MKQNVILWFTIIAFLAHRPSALVAQTSGEEEKVNNLIVQLLNDKDVKKRRLALMELEIYPRGKGVLQAVAVALEKDPEPVVRREAALTLARFGEEAKSAIPSLAYTLKNDKDETVREAAARALLQLVPHSRTALQQLLSALQDNHAPTRAAVAETILALGDQAKAAVPVVIDYLKAPKDKKADAVARMYLALALGRVGEVGAKGASVLIIVLADPMEEVSVREAAADSLGRIGPAAKGAAKPLGDIVADPKLDLALRLAAVKSLAKVPTESKQTWPALKIALTDGDATLRALCIRAGGPFGKDDPEVIATLTKFARTDDNVEVRLAAIQELGLLGPTAKSAEADLRYIADNDEREIVRQQAEDALKKIKNNPHG